MTETGVLHSGIRSHPQDNVIGASALWLQMAGNLLFNMHGQALFKINSILFIYNAHDSLNRRSWKRWGLLSAVASF